MSGLVSTVGMGFLSLASALAPLPGLLAIFVLSQTWQPPDPQAPPWPDYAYWISRFYVFAVLVVALLWLLAALRVINTNFWSLYDPEVESDPVPAMQPALQHWEELDLP